MVALPMARKPKKATAGKRVQMFSAVELKNIVAEWGMFGARLQAIADQMEKDQIRGIEIDGRDTPDRIREELIRFCKNARDGITKLEYGN